MGFPDATFSDDRPTRRVVSATSAPAPQTSGIASIFPPKAKKPRKPTVRVDPLALKIETGVPIPVLQPPPNREPKWPKLAKALQPGQMVRCPTQGSAKALERCLKAIGKATTLRKLSDTEVGVWVIEKAAGA